MKTKNFCAGIFLWLLIYSTTASAQLMKFLARETNGQVHLVDFTTGIPTVTVPAFGYGVTGSIDYEDVNLMTDVNNNILFSSCVYGNNFIEVRDANWAIMPNGSNLNGNSSVSQSALVRIPCSTNRYYFIHSTAIPNDLYYSVVDMSLNGGMGDVVQKNTFIQTNIGEGKTISHQLPTGCRWLIVPGYLNDTTFQVIRFLINDIGIGSPAVIATVNLSAIAYSYAMEVELSPDNTKLSMSTLRDNPLDPDIITWDFDLLSGTVSNRVDWNASTDPILGIEWSPDNTKVYFVGNCWTDDCDFGRINLTTGVVDIIDPLMGRFMMSVEKAGNGKVYVPPNYNQNYLAEVAMPNDNNVANIGYTHNGVFISSSGCRSPLPNALDGEPPGTTVTPQFIWFEANSTTNCNEYTFRDSSCLGTWWEWNFGDGTFSNSEFTTHQYLNSGTYDVTLRMVACGDTLTLTKPNYITVNINQTTASFQSATQFCEGSAVSLINTSTNATGYNWDFGDGLTDTIVNPVHIYSDTGTYVVTLIATGTTGCEDTTQVTISIVPNPVASFTSVVDTCSLSVAFQNTSSNGSTYSWSFGDLNTSNQQNPVHQYSSAGSYSVNLIITSGAGCIDTSATMSIDLPLLPIANFTSQISNCDSVATFTNQTQNSSSQLWDFGDGTFDTTANPTHTFHSTGNQTITLITYNQSGCPDTITQTLNVIADPMSAFSVSTDTCAQSIALQNTSQLANGYSWNFGDTYTSTQQNPSHQYSTDGTYTITLIASNAGLCFDTTDISVTIFPLPVAAFNSQISNCDSVGTFSSQSQNSVSQFWNFGDGTTDTASTVTHTFHATGNQLVTLISYNQFGCSDTTTQTLNVIQTPVSNFVLTEDTCSQNISIQNSSQYADGYNWNFGDATTSTQQNPVHHYYLDGSYTVTLISSNDGLCFDTSDFSVSIIPLPVAAFDFQVPDCDSYVQFNNLSQNSGSVFWSISDGSTYTTNNPLHNFTTMGLFDVTLTAYSPVSTCTSEVTQSVNMVPVPTASFNLQIDTCAQTIHAANTSQNASTYNWNFSDGTSETSESVSHLFPNGGNASVQLIATNINACSDTMALNFSIPPLPVADFLWTQAQCDSVVNFVEQCLNEVSYTWNFGDGSTSDLASPSHTYAIGGLMPVQLISTSAFGCVDTMENTLNMIIATPANFNVVIDSCAGNAIFLNQAPLAATYDWNFDQIASATTPNAVFSFPTNDLYIITLTVNKGTPCEAHSQEQINYYVNDGERVYIPNSFTPNEDGLNDIFKIENRVPCDYYSIDIFDRWGEEIFHADDALTDFWDGTYKSSQAAEGVYVYLLKGNSSKKVGHVLLIK